MAPRDANFVDGLRGVASTMVVTGHLCAAFATWMDSPTMGVGLAPSVFQLPFIRLVCGGPPAVALFFIITGYANALSPLVKARRGQPEAALNSIGRSALNRSGNLILPCACATLFSWLLANTNAYKMAEHIDSTWIRQGFHRQEPTVFDAVYTLLESVVKTWTVGWCDYDGTQWPMLAFLEGSFIVYTTMLATLLIAPRARKLCYGVLWLYAWMSREPVKTLNIAVGMLVSELQCDYGNDAVGLLPSPIPALIIFTGMFFAGFPINDSGLAGWSNTMQWMITPLVPEKADLRRYWFSMGASLVFIGCFFSRNARRVLTHPVFQNLGRISFPVYLLHNSLLKSVLTWMVYFPSWLNPPKNERGEQMDLQRGSPLHILIAIAVFYYILHRLATLWVIFVDPFCAKIVKTMTGWMYELDGHELKPTLPS